MRGRATTKLTITVPEELGAYIREQVDAGRFESISAFVTRAAESMRDFEPLDLLIASMIAETGDQTSTLLRGWTGRWRRRHEPGRRRGSDATGTWRE